MGKSVLKITQDTQEFFWQDYQRHARQTAVYPNKDNNLHYPTLGLVGEAGEFYEKFEKARLSLKDDSTLSESYDKFELDMALELGDVVWYIANTAKEAGIDLTELMNEAYLVDHDFGEDSEPYPLKLFISTGGVAEKVKKIERDNDGQITKDTQAELKFLLTQVCKNWLASCLYIGLIPEQVAEWNLEKLQGRAERGTLKGSGDNR